MLSVFRTTLFYFLGEPIILFEGSTVASKGDLLTMLIKISSRYSVFNRIIVLFVICI
jgi:hypothetical protein